MLFNSFEFICVFLPITLFVFFSIGTAGYDRYAISWLVAASLFYYGWWNPAYLALILASIIFNYSFGVMLGCQWSWPMRQRTTRKKTLIVLGITANVALLAYYKYENFFVDAVNAIGGYSYNLENIILPLAISFFTLQQVAYLVDVYRGEKPECDFLHYCLFVCFFPQLIAGPIVHHKEMLPQFRKDSIYTMKIDNLAIGITVFFIGLFKKVVLADNLALAVTPVFDGRLPIAELSFVQSWIAALAYTFQLYFDFSGYSDMAIGIARMFGIRLPLNFNSPYKSVNIIEFWRRWHITLSRFLRDYLYIPLGGGRHGKLRKQINLMVTMLLGGLWHGAGLTFVVWGGIHGLYLVINHAWHELRKVLGLEANSKSMFGHALSRFITFIAVVIGWVFFRAESLSDAISVLESMAGINGFTQEGVALNTITKAVFLASFIIIWYLPNVQQFMGRYDLVLGTHEEGGSRKRPRYMLFQYGFASAAFLGILILLSALTMQSVQKVAFLYYDF